ncbi:trichohyalin-like [Mercenaria mercenaria]|uniref:trichohyalin-like n=1 Tax=Mercenaria mercenaria TaxID=6596 RepID=UPI00234E609B|nr:trichohyalin-like [Mercenaria mercenaria]
MEDQTTDRDIRMRQRDARRQEQERLEEKQEQRDRLRQDLAEIENERQRLLSQRRNQQRLERPRIGAERLNISNPEQQINTGTRQILDRGIVQPRFVKQHNEDLGSYMDLISPEPENIPTATHGIGISGNEHESDNDRRQAIAQTYQATNRNLDFASGSLNMTEDIYRMHGELNQVIDRDDIRQSIRRDVLHIDQPRQESNLDFHIDRDRYRDIEYNADDISYRTRSRVAESTRIDAETHVMSKRDRNGDKVDVSIETDKLEVKLRQLSIRKDTSLDINSLQRGAELPDHRKEHKNITPVGIRMNPELKDTRSQLKFIDRKFREHSDINVRGELNDDNSNTSIKSEKFSILQQIEKKKMELQELLLIQENTEKQLKIDEERRLIELEKQRKMLHMLTERERVMDEREQKLKDDERELLLKFEELKRIKQDVVKSEEEQFVQYKAIERDIITKNEALDKRESDLRKQEEIVKELQQKLVPEVKKETIIQQTPEISPFSGDEAKPKSEVTLNEWKAEIRSLIATALYPEKMITQAVRKSLKGQAKKVLLNLDPNARAEEIIERTEDIFGDMSSKQTIYTEFYTASQKPDESIADWGLRLEEILIKASTKKSITPDERNEMLKDKFWRSLYSKDIKNAVRTSFESGDSFEMLRRKARAEEHETKISAIKADIALPKQEETANAADKQTELLEAMMKQMAELNKKVEDYRKENESKPQDEHRNRRYGGYNRWNGPRDFNRWNGSRDYNRGANSYRNRFDDRSHKLKEQSPDTDKKQEEKKGDIEVKEEKKQNSEKELN